jgi:hypothetical protein
LSRNALHGQLNVGHAIHDRDLANAFLQYWTALKGDPKADELKDWAETNNGLPPDDDSDLLTPVFSPHRGRDVFDWWIALANAPGKPLFMTFPFGIVKDFRPVFDKNDDVLRFGLLDKYVNGGNQAMRAAAIADIQRIRRHPNIGMALGERIFVDWIDGWHQESSPIGVNVNWVHTKFMLIDPLGPKPVTLMGSANWSEPSVSDNDENMVVIRGDKRVADIYFGEFMRIFAHHRFRESVARYIKQFGSAAFNTWKPQDLFEDWRKWVPMHFKPASHQATVLCGRVGDGGNGVRATSRRTSATRRRRETGARASAAKGRCAEIARGGAEEIQGACGSGKGFCAVRILNNDSYSSLERRLLVPARELLRAVFSPFVALLAALHISPNMVSFSQVILAVVVVWLMPTQPRAAFLLFVAAIALDGIDGALARATNRVTKFGALFDQYCDHIREVIVVAGLAWHGALNPFLAGIYGVTYPGFNLTLYLCNVNRAPLPFAIKSYLVVYPALFAYLWFGANFLDYAVALSVASMGIAVALGLWRLARAMD